MAVKETNARPSLLSAEYVQDSSEERDESEKSDNAEEDSSREAGEDDSAIKSTLNGAESTSAQGDEATPISSDSSQDSSSSDDERDKSDEGESPVSGGGKKRTRESKKTTETSQRSKRQKKSNDEAPLRIASKPFKPPLGFEPIVLDASDYVSGAAEIFANLSSKQVWHISAPASVNISSIKQFDISAALKGDPIITEDGFSYTLQPSTSSTETLILPKDTDGVYRPSNTRISRGFQLRAIGKEGHHSNNASSSDLSSPLTTENLTFTAQAPGVPKPPRQQPAGLKTRYVPYGVINRDQSTKMVPIFPSVNDPVNRESATTNTDRTPSKSQVSAPAATSDPMDLHETSLTTKMLGGSPQKAADPSPAKPSVSDSPREEQKKKKKRSRLVDDHRL